MYWSICVTCHVFRAQCVCSRRRRLFTQDVEATRDFSARARRLSPSSSLLVREQPSLRPVKPSASSNRWFAPRSAAASVAATADTRADTNAPLRPSSSSSPPTAAPAALSAPKPGVALPPRLEASDPSDNSVGRGELAAQPASPPTAAVLGGVSAVSSPGSKDRLMPRAVLTQPPAPGAVGPRSPSPRRPRCCRREASTALSRGLPLFRVLSVGCREHAAGRSWDFQRRGGAKHKSYVPPRPSPHATPLDLPVASLRKTPTTTGSVTISARSLSA